MRQKLAEFFELLYDFRQFITFFVLLFVAVIFRVDNFINGNEFVDLMKNVSVALFAVHGLQHIMSVGKDFIAAKYSQGGDGDDSGAIVPVASKDNP